MTKKKKKKFDEEELKALFHKDLSGFDIKVNAFGELESSFGIDRLNAFLNDKVDDKKLVQRDDGGDEEE